MAIRDTVKVTLKNGQVHSLMATRSGGTVRSSTNTKTGMLEIEELNAGDRPLVLRSLEIALSEVAVVATYQEPLASDGKRRRKAQ